MKNNIYASIPIFQLNWKTNLYIKIIIFISSIKKKKDKKILEERKELIYHATLKNILLPVGSGWCSQSVPSDRMSGSMLRLFDDSTFADIRFNQYRTLRPYFV